jgi:hypothetical protein
MQNRTFGPLFSSHAEGPHCATPSFSHLQTPTPSLNLKPQALQQTAAVAAAASAHRCRCRLCDNDALCLTLSPPPGGQLDYRLALRDLRWHCQRSFELHLADGNLDIFFFDTNPFITRYYNDSWAGNHGGWRLAMISYC